MRGIDTSFTELLVFKVRGRWWFVTTDATGSFVKPSGIGEIESSYSCLYGKASTGFISRSSVSVVVGGASPGATLVLRCLRLGRAVMVSVAGPVTLVHAPLSPCRCMIIHISINYWSTICVGTSNKAGYDALAVCTINAVHECSSLDCAPGRGLSAPIILVEVFAASIDTFKAEEAGAVTLNSPPGACVRVLLVLCSWCRVFNRRVLLLLADLW